ncbi:MAG: hypothetical protein ACD_75C02356G0001 [uncultured bacterium]|nr:MAG: hypothetical protein ACD_75C02356G0001 [uncultured bacterium]
MRLLEEAVGVDRHLVELAEIGGIFLGPDGGCQNNHVGCDLQRPVQDVIPDLDLDVIAHLGYLRLTVQFIVDEDYAEFARLLEEGLTLGVGPHIPIEDVDVALGIFLFQGDGRLHGMSAANLRAVHVVGLS